MPLALYQDASQAIFDALADTGVHVARDGTRTDCQVIVSDSREMAGGFEWLEHVGPRRAISVREAELASVVTGDTFEVAGVTYNVDARLEAPGDYHCITVAVTRA